MDLIALSILPSKALYRKHKVERVDEEGSVIEEDASGAAVNLNQFADLGLQNKAV